MGGSCAVRTADRIVVLDTGRIVEQGTHAQLIALNGHYADMYATQARSYHATQPT